MDMSFYSLYEKDDKKRATHVFEIYMYKVGNTWRETDGKQCLMKNFYFL